MPSFSRLRIHDATVRTPTSLLSMYSSTSGSSRALRSAPAREVQPASASSWRARRRVWRSEWPWPPSSVIGGGDKGAQHGLGHWAAPGRQPGQFLGAGVAAGGAAGVAEQVLDPGVAAVEHPAV